MSDAVDGRSAVAARFLRGWAAPQHRDGLALIASTVVSSAVGLVYWVLAARWFDPAAVGVGSTIISTLTLLGGAAQLNLGSALLRFVPTAGGRGRELVVGCYAVGALSAVVVGAVFGLGARWWAPTLEQAVGRGPLVVFFVCATPVWAWFTMQDYVLTALRRASLVPVENLAFALLKIGILLLGWLLAAPAAVAGSWAAATGVIVLGITVVLLRLLPAPRAGEPPATVTPRVIARFVAADWAGALCALAVNFGLALVVLARLGPDLAASFGVAWAIAFALYLVPAGMGQSLVAHTAGAPGSLEQARRSMVTKSLTLVVPAVAVVAPGAGLILTVFGPHYAATAAPFLALAACSAVPNVITAAAVATGRVRQERLLQLGVPASVAVLTIPTAWLLMTPLGLTGVGVALLTGQSVTAAVVLLRNRRSARQRRCRADQGRT